MPITDYNVRIVVETTPLTYYRKIQTDVFDSTITDPANPGIAVRDFVISSTEDNVPTATSSLLAITSNVGSAIINDVTNVVADPSDTKTVQISIVRVDATSALEILAREKTTENYADIPAGKTLEQHIKEFQVAAAGTVLTEV